MIKEIVNKERKYNEMNQYVIFLLWLSPVGMCTGMKQCRVKLGGYSRVSRTHC